MRQVLSRAMLLLMLWESGALPLHASDSDEAGRFRAGHILDSRTGADVPQQEFLDILAAQDILYLGEEHHNRWHIAAAVSVIDALIEHGRRPVLALEMFGWDGQEALDRYLQAGSDRREFLRDTQWEHNWGGAFEDYEPLILAAQRHHLSVAALNPPLPLVRRVAKQGLVAALFDPDMARWRMRTETFVDNGPYRDAIVQQLRRCHGGMPDDGYERMYQASLFRDEAMAKTIAALLATSFDRPRGPVVSYTGGGHIQYGLPVPDRVNRRRPQARGLTVYFSALDPSRQEEIAELIRSHIADYIWLTPVSENGPPKRCG